MLNLSQPMKRRQEVDRPIVDTNQCQHEKNTTGRRQTRLL